MAQWQTLSDRINTVAPSATLAVDSKAKAMKAAGLDVVGFGAGEPNFPTPANVVKAAADACLDPKNYKYTPTPGLPELREAIAAKMLRDSGYEVNADQVVVTNGGKQAVYESFQILLNDGDEVIIPAPYWTSYPEAVKLAGGVPVEVFAGADVNFEPSLEALEAARTEHTKAIIVNSPNNPTGAVWKPETVEAIGRWAVEHFGTSGDGRIPIEFDHTGTTTDAHFVAGVSTLAAQLVLHAQLGQAVSQVAHGLVVVEVGLHDPALRLDATHLEEHFAIAEFAALDRELKRTAALVSTTRTAALGLQWLDDHASLLFGLLAVGHFLTHLVHQRRQREVELL